MGLSASSLRLAMLTARKSSLEFEGQQINQQRLSLSNQTAALFNAMLTMQVPTPPDPTEFSKMVYTFNKGNGVSTLLNVSRNSSGAFSHDVTYIGPKTDNVLMKKQLNNVGFKHENGQMSAVIDGLSYALSLNGNQEKLEEYVKTKNTYDNVKNVETQMQALNQMPQDKELSSSQMKQYFEALGLSSYNTPKQGKVDDVKTMDDAFQNLYNSGEIQKMNFTHKYYSTTSPKTLSPDTDYMLTLKDNQTKDSIIMVDGDDKHYTYTNENDTEYDILYNDENKTWTYSAKDATEDDLSNLGITYENVLKYTNASTKDASYNVQKGYQISDYTNDNFAISNCYYKDKKWSYDVTPSNNITFKKNDDTEVAITAGETYDSGDDKGVYTISGTYPALTFTRIEQINEPVNDNIIDNWTLEEGCSSFNISTNSKVACLKNSEFILNKETEIYEAKNLPDSLGVNCQIDSNGLLTVTESKNEFKDDGPNIFHNALGIISENTNVTPEPSNYFICVKSFSNSKNIKKATAEVDAYYLNLANSCVAYKENNITSSSLSKQIELITDKNELSTEHGEQWVKVKKNDEGKWQYTYQLTDNDSSIIKQTKTCGEKTYMKDEDGQFSITDAGIKYTLTQENGQNRLLYNASCNKSLSEVGLTAYYNDTPLDTSGKYHVENSEIPPSGIDNDSLICKDKYIYSYKDEKTQKTVTENSYADLNSQCTFSDSGVKITKKDEKKYEITSSLPNKDCLPPNVCTSEESKRTETEEKDGIKYSITQEFGENYHIKATFEAYGSSDGKNQYYQYDEKNHSLKHLITDEEVAEKTKQATIAQMLLRNQNNEKSDNDRCLTVNEMLGFFEEVLKQFGLYGSSATYKTKLDKAKSDYLSTIDAKGVENPKDNEVLFSFIDAKGKNAYIYVPLDYINKDGQVDSTYAYMYETSYLENQTETISQKANIIYDENGRIVKISFDDGTVVLPEIKTEQDDEAYNAAMVKYDYEKQVYDKELSDINAKTEIIAQQDKNLELKLKSIDTQHSAISTEIEALNKVLQNNVKSGFNTFNA